MKQELFSERIKNYRLAWNLSQEQLGESLGVSARYVGMLENGTKEVEDTSSLAKLFSLMEAKEVHGPEENFVRQSKTKAKGQASRDRGTGYPTLKPDVELESLFDELKSLLSLAEKTGRPSYFKSVEDVISEIEKRVL